ncbi:Uma2 family endonuclease, partial [Tolypothrix sp. VBCCA 56010]|uniref:Uma2 family endonuclease n=1 Tax=Tolypothrix sp. VBCCA 56010 TaxID=3137731 RepID=UPI003D7E0BE6
MTPQLADKVTTLKEQQFLLPGYYTWEEFEKIEALTASPALRITYLDGYIQFMTLGEEHEMLKTIIGFLLELYLCEMSINFIPVGSATRRSQEKGASFEPDESYYLREKKENPDLAIEINIAILGYVRYTRRGTALPCPYTRRYNVVPHLNGN